MGCPLGALNCPLRHTTPMPLNFQPPAAPPANSRDRDRLSTVRTLCFILNESPDILSDRTLRCVSIGFEGFAKRVTHASSCTSTTSGACPNAGGSQSTATVLKVMSASISIREKEKSSAQTTIVDTASLVSRSEPHVLIWT